MRGFSSLILLLYLVFSFTSVAQAPALKADMKELGGLFKSIVKTATDPTENSKNAESATQMVELFKEVQTLVPDSIQAMPAIQQGAALKEFQATIQIEINNATALALAFKANDNASASKIIQDMATTKKAAHDKFDPHQ